jgi:hypothetical protein
MLGSAGSSPVTLELVMELAVTELVAGSFNNDIHCSLEGGLVVGVPVVSDAIGGVVSLAAFVSFRLVELPGNVTDAYMLLAR